jgi:hypothetical protein
MSVSFLHIEHVVTSDMPDGQALPPFIEDGVVWHIVHRSPEHKTTLWRRITVQTSNTSPSTAAARPRENLGGE